MGDEQRGEAHDVVGQEVQLRRKALVCHKEHHQGDTGDDLGVDRGDIGDIRHQQAALAPHGGDAQRRRSPQHGGDDRREQCQIQRHPQRVQDGLVVEQAGVPLKGKAGKEGVALALVEAEHDHVRDGQVHEAEEQDDVGALHQTQMFRFHQDTPSISSSSKLDVKLMQSSTMTISTRLMAEPTLRL